MKKLFIWVLGIFMLTLFVATTPACKVKEGCAMNESAHAKPNKKGEYGSKRGRTNLFPKNMRKN